MVPRLAVALVLLALGLAGFLAAVLSMFGARGPDWIPWVLGAPGFLLLLPAGALLAATGPKARARNPFRGLVPAAAAVALAPVAYAWSLFLGFGPEGWEGLARILLVAAVAPLAFSALLCALLASFADTRFPLAGLVAGLAVGSSALVAFEMGYAFLTGVVLLDATTVRLRIGLAIAVALALAAGMLAAVLTGRDPGTRASRRGRAETSATPK